LPDDGVGAAADRRGAREAAAAGGTAGGAEGAEGVAAADRVGCKGGSITGDGTIAKKSYGLSLDEGVGAAANRAADIADVPDIADSADSADKAVPRACCNDGSVTGDGTFAMKSNDRSVLAGATGTAAV